MVYANASRHETAKQAVDEVMELKSGAKAVSIMADLTLVENHEKIIHQTLEAFNVETIDIIGKRFPSKHANCQGCLGANFVSFNSTQCCGRYTSIN